MMSLAKFPKGLHNYLIPVQKFYKINKMFKNWKSNINNKVKTDDQINIIYIH